MGNPIIKNHCPLEMPFLVGGLDFASEQDLLPEFHSQEREEQSAAARQEEHASPERHDASTLELWQKSPAK